MMEGAGEERAGGGGGGGNCSKRKVWTPELGNNSDGNINGFCLVTNSLITAFTASRNASRRACTCTLGSCLQATGTCSLGSACKLLVHVH